MLYIIEKVGTTEGTHQWHVGSSLPVNLKVDRVVEVQANEDELRYLLTHFNLPVCSHKKSISWFGDMAKFIVANLL